MDSCHSESEEGDSCGGCQYKEGQTDISSKEKRTLTGSGISIIHGIEASIFTEGTARRDLQFPSLNLCQILFSTKMPGLDWFLTTIYSLHTPRKLSWLLRVFVRSLKQSHLCSYESFCKVLQTCSLL